MKIYELEEITKPYLSELRKKLVETGYIGSFTFDYEDVNTGEHFNSQYLLHQVEEFPQ